jgi:hypothetical protein
VVQRIEVTRQDPGPPLERRREVAADPEGEVDVRPLVAAAHCVRARDRRADDVRVVLGQREQALPHAVPLGDGEQRYPARGA